MTASRILRTVLFLFYGHLAMVFLFAGSSEQTPSPAYDRLYVFGDSYSDIGEGYLDGNGPTSVAYLAGYLHLSIARSNDSDVAGKSIDFAVSGAGTGSGEGSHVEDALLGLGMQNQVADFSERVRQHAISFRPETTLFFIAGGLNDRKLPSEKTIENLESEIRTLYGLGARQFAVALLPTAIPAFADVGQRLNPELTLIPGHLAAELPAAHIRLSHWGLFFDEVMYNPAAYGIENTKDACAGRAIFHQDATPCPSPETYFYFHAGHPSTAVHKIVGEKLYQELMGAAPLQDAAPDSQPGASK